MATSTQISLEAGARALETLLIDDVQIMDVTQPVTTGAYVSRELTPVGAPIKGLVQSVSLENAIEGRVSQLYSVKLPVGTEIEEGQAVKVLACDREAALVGQVVLLDTVSRNGLAMLRKGTGQATRVVNQEGKEALA